MIRYEDIKTVSEIFVTKREFDQSHALLKYGRTMDHFTRQAIYTAEKLLRSTGLHSFNIDSGLIIASCTGPYSSIKETAIAVKESGYRSINPGYFPNVMSSTALSYMAQRFDIQGPTCSILTTIDNISDVWDYTSIQILCGHCIAMVEIYVNDYGWSKGKYLIGRINE